MTHEEYSIYDRAGLFYENLFSLQEHDSDEMADNIVRTVMSHDRRHCTEHSGISLKRGNFLTEEDLKKEREELRDYKF